MRVHRDDRGPAGGVIEAAALWLALAAVGQSAVAPYDERIVAPGQQLPDDMRPCVDYVARGRLTYRSYHPIDTSGDLIGHAVYSWRFNESQRFRGIWIGKGHDLARLGHALRRESWHEVVVFVARDPSGKRRWIDWSFVWTDSRGRAFLPILRWPDARDRGSVWMPDATRRLARLVNYHWPQP